MGKLRKRDLEVGDAPKFLLWVCLTKTLTELVTLSLYNAPA